MCNMYHPLILLDKLDLWYKLLINIFIHTQKTVLFNVIKLFKLNISIDDAITISMLSNLIAADNSQTLHSKCEQLCQFTIPLSFKIL